MGPSSDVVVVSEAFAEIFKVFEIFKVWENLFTFIRLRCVCIAIGPLQHSKSGAIGPSQHYNWPVAALQLARRSIAIGPLQPAWVLTAYASGRPGVF